MRFTWPLHEERRWWAHKCYDSFWWFFMYAWGAQFNPEGTFICEEIHKPMCDWFEEKAKHWLERRGTDEAYRLNLAILVPRRVGKSLIFTNVALTWLHLRDPNISTFIGSHTRDFAIELMAPIQNVLNGTDPYSRFSWLYGNWYNKDRTWKNYVLTHGARQNVSRRDPSFGVWGVETGLVGKHPDVLDLDDPTSYEKIGSDANWLQTVNSHIISLEPVIEKDGLMMWVGTRYADGDHFGTFLKREGIKSITGMYMPGQDATFNDKPVLRHDGMWHVYYLQGRDKAGKPSIPTVWDEPALQKFENQDPLQYASQIMNDPSSSIFTPLTRDQLAQMVVPAEGVPFRNLVYSIHMDTSFKTIESRARGDESVIQLWGHYRDGSGDVIYCGGWSSHRWRIEHFLDKMVEVLRDCAAEGKIVKVITDEKEVGGRQGNWEMTIRNAINSARLRRVPEIILLGRGGKKKLHRIMNGVHFWVNGHVKLLKNAPGLDSLMEQMAGIGTSALDDYADSAADVFNIEVYSAMRPHFTEEPLTEEDLASPWDTVIKDGVPAREIKHRLVRMAEEAWLDA